MELVGRALAAPGEIAWVEDPGYWRTRDALRNAGLKPAPVVVDANGFDVARARQQSRARLAVVTPARQFPTGAAHLCALRTRTDRMMDVGAQLALDAFMERGELAAHIRTCHDVYAARRTVLLSALRQSFGRERVGAPSVGLHLTLALNEGVSDRALRLAAQRAGVAVSAFSDHALLPCRPGLFLGFAPFAEGAIRDAVSRLAEVHAALLPASV